MKSSRAVSIDDFDRAQLGDQRLHRRVALAQDAFLRLRVLLDDRRRSASSSAVELALFLLQRLVAARRRGLALQVAQLLLDFLAHVVQALEVFLGVRDAILGLAAALLVLGDAGRLFDEAAQLFGPRLDDARDHALLDDRVAARAEAGAEEQLRDVLAAAARAVQEVGRRAVARHDALQRDLGVAGVLAGELAVGVVEHQLDRGRADRLARAGAVEHDVGHRVAAQVLGGDLAHDPADGIDDVGLAAAVRTDDADQIAGEIDGGRIDEGLETGQLDLIESHRAS